MGKQDHRTQKLELFKFFQGQLDELDMYLVEFHKLKPELLTVTLTEYFQVLSAKILPSQISKGFPVAKFSQEKWHILTDFLPKIELVQPAMLSFLHLENFPLAEKEHLEEDNVLDVPFGDYVRCGYYHVYYFFHALKNLKGKDIAYDITRQIAEIFYTKPRPNQKRMESVVEFGEWIDGLCKQTHNFISGEDEENRFINKVVGCVWGESLQSVEDPDLMYFLICYGDFFTPKSKNENFELTRNYTLLQGHAMCDFCYHDSRMHKELIHPTPDFWDELTDK